MNILDPNNFLISSEITVKTPECVPGKRVKQVANLIIDFSSEAVELRRILVSIRTVAG